MTNIDYSLAKKLPKRSITRDGGEPPEGKGLEKRIEVLEKAIPDIKVTLARLEGKIDSIEKHGATKNDISQMEIHVSRWMYGLVFGVIVLIIRSFL